MPYRLGQRTLAVAALAVAMAACPKRMVVVEGRAIPYDEAARAAYEDAMRSRAEGRTDEALAKLDRFVVQYADSDLVDDALAAIGDMARERGEVERARRAFEKLLLEHPRSEHAAHARLELARIDIERGRPQDAVAPLRSVYDELRDPAERREVALQLGEILDRSGSGGEAVEWYLRAYDLADDSATRDRVMGRIFTIVDSRLSFEEVRLLAEKVGRDSPVAEMLTYKLARVYCHLRDFAQCRETLERYLRDYPAGTYAAAARQRLERLRARLEVDPTAVGLVLPLGSERYKIYAERALWAVRAGLGLLDEKNGEGGVRLVVRDSGGTPEGAAEAVEELVLQEHVVVVLGAILQSTSLAAALKAEELGVPLLTFSWREGLCDLGPNIFRYGLTSSKQARALADLAVGKLGMRRFAILYPRHRYGLELMNAFWDEIERRHAVVVGAEAYDHDETTFVDEIKRLVGRSPLRARPEYLRCAERARRLRRSYARRKALEACEEKLPPVVDFDALFIPDDSRAVGLIAPTLAFEDVLTSRDEEAVEAYRKTTGFKDVHPVQLLGASGWNDPTLPERGGQYVAGALFVDGFNPYSGEERVRHFVERFAAAMGSPPSVMEAQAYDGARLVATIVRGKVAPAPRTRAEMRERLRGVRDFPGVTGVTSFDDRGESVTPLVVFAVTRTGIEVADLEAFSGS